MNQLTEAKELNRQAAEKIKEYELLEEARRRGFVEGVKFKSAASGFTKELLNDVFIYKNEDGTHVIDSEPNNGNYVYFEGKGWAEIIPEEEKKIETCPECGYITNGIIAGPEKSLHDQIREGGWDFVINKAGKGEYEYMVGDNECGRKTEAYIKLLALSKVLNEGKERHTIRVAEGFVDGEVISNRAQVHSHSGPIGIYDDDDFTFALDFAEKEWKLFYNAK